MSIEIIPNWHPIFVHFPIALVVISTLSFLLGIMKKDLKLSRELIAVSKWCLWLAAIFSIITAYTGWLAYNSVAHDAPSHQAMTQHRNWALSTASLIVVLAMVVFFFRDTWGKKKKLLSFFTLIALTCSVLITAWLGAETVYRYGIGVMSLPKADTPHTHNAAEEAHHMPYKAQKPVHDAHHQGGDHHPH